MSEYSIDLPSSDGPLLARDFAQPLPTSWQVEDEKVLA